jgi:alpha-L-rhamnosidase
MTSKIDRREFLIASGAMAGVAAVASSPLRAKTVRVFVIGLKVDYIDRPLGLENLKPRLSWRLESEARNVRQSGYRILVAGSEAALKAGRGDLWDSGRINSRKSFGIPYEGRALASRERCWWSVQVWDERDEASDSSAASWWEMGLLVPKDWTAQWLAVEDPTTRADREAGPRWIWGEPSNEKSTRQFRFTFELPIASQGGELFAVVNDWLWTAQVTGIWVDGQAVKGDPARRGSHNWSAVAEDSLTAQRLALDGMSAGEHSLAIEVASGSLPPPMRQAFALRVRFELTNGEMLRLGSGQGWKTHLTADEDWYTRHYDDRAWNTVQAVDLEGFHPMPAAPAMYLRRSFSLDKPVRQARLYATALGAYEAHINGSRVGDALLTPEQSQYAERVLYRVYDVTAMLQSGANVLGLTVGDGWYASWEGLYSWGPPPRRVLAQLEVTFADGSRGVIATGPGWRTAQSPIRRSEIRVGEFYDARLEQRGWDTVGFDDAQWREAEIAKTPPCRVVAQASPPIRVVRRLKPQSIKELQPGVFIFDFGQNFTGWCRLRVTGERGTEINLDFAEVLTSAGDICQDTYDIGELKRDTFILRGAASEEIFEPHFTFHGFRYVRVTGLSTPPTLQSLEGVFIHSDLDITGRIRVDSPMIQQIWTNTRWTLESNTLGILMDCPNREQRGWMGDAGVLWDAAAYNVDFCAFTARQMSNVADDQFPDGRLPQAAPEPRHSNSTFKTDGGPIWADGSVILPWTSWQHYGDLAVVEKHWDLMNRYLHFILDHNPDYVWRNERGADYGDLIELGGTDFVELRARHAGSIPTTPHDLVATAYWAHSTDLLAQMSQAIGRSGDAIRLRAQFERIRDAFNRTFVKADGTVGTGSQCSYVLALRFGLLPESIKRAAVERLASDVRQRGVSLTTGYPSTQFILDVLADGGFPDLAYGLLLRTDFPSWGYMIRCGATTMWDAWDDFYDNGVRHKSSQSQPALGAICGFMYRRIAGIEAAAPGFEEIVVRPVFDARVKRGGGDYDSIMGRISTNWVQTESGFTLEVTIPANASARIHLPARRSSSIKEGRKMISRFKDIQVTDRLDHEVVINVGSGKYLFVVDQ